MPTVRTRRSRNQRISAESRRMLAEMFEADRTGDDYAFRRQFDEISSRAVVDGWWKLWCCPLPAFWHEHGPDVLGECPYGPGSHDADAWQALAALYEDYANANE